MNLFKIFCLLSLIFLVKTKQTTKEFLIDGPEKYEFIEEFKDETYLLYIKENDRNYLDLLNLDKSFKQDDMSGDKNVYFFCPKDFYKSLSMSSFYMPVQKPQQVDECPKMKETCCSVSDIDKLKTQWNEKYKKYYLIQIMSHHEKIRQAALNVIKNDGSEPMCNRIAQQIVDTQFGDSELSQLKTHIANITKFDQNMKQNYMCFLCDFHSLKNIDFNNKLVKLNYKVCENVVDKTFDTFYYFNSFVFKYINNAQYLSYCYDYKDHSLLGKYVNQGDKIPTYLSINNSRSIDQCKLAKTFNLNIMGNCFQYCQRFDFWYYKNHYFKDIYKLSEIFDSINQKIFQNKIKFKITKPLSIQGYLPIFEVKYNRFNVFDYFQYIYVEDGGLQPQFLFQMNKE